MMLRLSLTPYQAELLEILLEDAVKSKSRKKLDGGAHERRLIEYTAMQKQIERKLHGA